MRKFTITVNGVPYKVEVQDDGEIEAIKPVKETVAAVKSEINEVPKVENRPIEPSVSAAPVSAAEVKPVAAGETAITAPMPGKIIQVKVNIGDKVKKGDVVVILEAMKMQNEIKTASDGEIRAVNVAQGQSVKPGEVMVVVG